MANKKTKIFFSWIFQFIFLAKMVLSVAPLFVDIDKATVNAVILQVELETHGDSNELAKESKNSIAKYNDINLFYDFSFRAIVNITNLKYHLEPRNYTSSYFPSIPTPPPNIA